MRYCGGAGVSRIDREGPIHRAILHYLRVVLPGAIIHHSASEGVRGGKAGYMDGAKRKGIYSEMANIMRDTGGLIAPMFNDWVEGRRAEVGGWVANPQGTMMNGFALSKCWLTA